MRRRPRVLPQARTRVADRVRTLSVSEEAKWPKHLKYASRILRDELGLHNQQARELTFNSVSPAHACAQAIDRRANSIGEYDTRIKTRQAFARVWPGVHVEDRPGFGDLSMSAFGRLWIVMSILR
jgi:hypothetical protein